MPHTPYLHATDDGVTIDVKVVPGAKRDAIVGPLGECLKIRVTAPPEAGKANDAVRAILADALNVPRSSITLLTGASQPRKRFAVTGLDLPTATARLARHIGSRHTGNR